MRRSRLLGFGRMKRLFARPFRKEQKFYNIAGNVYEYDNQQGVLRGVSRKVKGKIIQLKGLAKK